MLSLVVMPTSPIAPAACAVDDLFTAANADPVLLTVFQTSAPKFATGAGWIVDPSFNDIPVKVEPTRNHGIFAFAVSSRPGASPQGVAIYEFRGFNGYDYFFTITSWTGGSLSFGTGTASFSGTANWIVEPGDRLGDGFAIEDATPLPSM